MGTFAAPIASEAKSVTAHSQRFSPISAMRSPLRTPQLRKVSASARTRWYIWSDEIGSQCPNSSCQSTARGLAAAAMRQKRSLIVEICVIADIGLAYRSQIFDVRGQSRV